MNIEKFLKVLEDMPTGVCSKLKLGENENCLKKLKETQPALTMDDIKEHNIEAKGWDDGFKAAVEIYKKWRNKEYLIFKRLT